MLVRLYSVAAAGVNAADSSRGFAQPSSRSRLWLNVPISETLRERGRVLLEDPLSEVARKERRTLLAVATAGYLVTKTGLVPTQIQTLGITFTASEQKTLLSVFALVVVYFVVAFILYAATDALAWAWAIYIAKRQLWEEVETGMAARASGEPTSPRPEHPRFLYRNLIPVVAFLRGLWDFAVPVAIGIYVAYLLLRAQP
jgi:hypothetical protein